MNIKEIKSVIKEMEGDLTDIEKQLVLEDWSWQNLFIKKIQEY